MAFSAYEASALRTYRIFISHAWTYSTGYNRLVDMLDGAPRFKWYNHSVPSDDPLEVNSTAELERKLRKQIQGTNCVVVLAGMYYNHREWMIKEIEIAQEFGKPIVGIRPRGNKVTPAVLTLAAKEIVGWNTDSIVSAIRKHSKF